MSEFEYEDWFAHFNPNHDPRNGRFAKSSALGLSDFKPSKTSVVAASVASAATAYRVGKHWIDAYVRSRESDLMSESDLRNIKKKGIYKTGKAAITIGLVTYGAVKLSELMSKDNVRDTTNSKKRNLSLKDIDDPELIDPAFRKEYNVTDQEYNAWKRRK